MRSRCEQLRERALNEGLGSRSALAWRVHCRSCANCRTELYVLETLERQAVQERRHIGRRELADLLRVAQDRQAAKPPQSLNWVLRFACVGLFIMVATELHRQRRGAGQLSSASLHVASPAASAPSEQYAAAALPTSPASPAVQTVPAAPGTPTAAVAGPPQLGNGMLEQRIYELRRRVRNRRRTLLDLMEQDLGDGIRDDVWDRPLPWAAALA